METKVPGLPLNRGKQTSPWWLVLCLVGIDYFSTLAYIPSLANEIAGAVAPYAVMGVVAVTFLLALPAYVYVTGRSNDGRGATGLLQRSIAGWRGKIIMLMMMGFVAADFIITRSLSISDAAVHVLGNSHVDAIVDQYGPTTDWLATWLPGGIVEKMRPFWNRQIGVTVMLSLVSMSFMALFARGFTRRSLKVAAAVVVIFMGATLAVLIRCGIEIWNHPELWHAWTKAANTRSASATEGFVLLLFFLFPQLALGISGFELSMTVVPLIQGEPGDAVQQHKQRINRARMMMLALTVIMAVFMIGCTLVTSVLIPPEAFTSQTEAKHRALAFLAHGELFPVWFGTFYDLSTAIILCLAGVSVTVGLRDLVPVYLHKLGMEMTWARKYGIFMLLCNAVILMATVVFKASVEAQEGAYATSVLALLAGCNLAAAADLKQRYPKSWPVRSAMFIFGLVFFLIMALIIVWKQPGGVIISAAFLVLVFMTSFWSRWRRSLETRVTGFEFANDHSKERWQVLCGVDYEILVPHRPGHFSMADKNEDIRTLFRIPTGVPIIFIEAQLGDTSEFDHVPVIDIQEEDGLEVLRISQCASVSHVIAAVALEFSKVGQPPEVIFGWSLESPMTASMSFLFMGVGNVPWMVQELVRLAEPDEAKRPRIVVG